MTLLNLEKFLGTRINRIDYHLDNLNKIYVDEAKRLQPDDNYIGFSLTQGNVYRKKSWLINNFMDLATKIGEKSKVPVIKHLEGICHIYVDGEANIETAKEVIFSEAINSI